MNLLYFAKRVANLVTPPVLTKIVVRVQYLWFKKTIQEGVGYLDEDIAEVVFRKNSRLLLKKVQIIENEENLFLLAAISVSSGIEGSDFIKVVDFGGGGGNALRIAESIFARIIDSWTVIETEPMVNACESLAGNSLKFHTLDQVLGKFEIDVSLLYSFCALQYTEDPLDIFEKLLTLKPKVVCISKIALSTNEKVIEIAEFSKLSSNGPGSELGPIEDSIIRYPSRAVPKNDFEEKLSEDYKIISRIDHGSSRAHRAAGATSARLFSYLAIVK